MYKPKICQRCNNIYSPNSSVQKFCSSCKDIAHLEWKRQHYEKNKEKISKQTKEWYWKNLEKARNIKRKWNWSEKGRLNRKEWENEHRLEINERSKGRRKEQSLRIKSRIIYIKSKQKLECINTHKGKVEIHHVDGNLENNDLANLLPVCRGCHSEIHHKQRLITFLSNPKPHK